MADFEIKDNSKKLLKELQEQIALGLEGIGVDAQRFAVRDCPVDTGRLRNSITYAIKDKQGQANTNSGETANREDYEKRSEPEKNTMYLGTNVEYAEIQEFGDTIDHVNGKAHFLRDAVATHSSRFKSIMQSALEDKGG